MSTCWEHVKVGRCRHSVGNWCCQCAAWRLWYNRNYVITGLLTCSYSQWKYIPADLIYIIHCHVPFSRFQWVSQLLFWLAFFICTYFRHPICLATVVSVALQLTQFLLLLQFNSSFFLGESELASSAGVLLLHLFPKRFSGDVERVFYGPVLATLPSRTKGNTKPDYILHHFSCLHNQWKYRYQVL